MTSLPEIDHGALRTLAAAVRLGTFEAAARELHVTPSAVSQRIKALETRVGRVLLHRAKPLQPTEAGQVLVRLASQMDLLEREAVAELVEQDDEEPEGGTPYALVPLAVNSDTLATFLLDAMVRVQQAHRVTFELVRDDETLTLQHLRRGDVMAAATLDPKPVPGCRVVPLGRIRYRAVATPEYVATHLPDGPTPTALGSAPVIDFDRSDSMQSDFLRRVTRKHLDPPRTYIPSVWDFEAAVRRGIGWGMLLESQVYDDLADGNLVELVPGRRAQRAVYWQHWKLETPLMHDLTEAVVAAAADVLG